MMTRTARVAGLAVALLSIAIAITPAEIQAQEAPADAPPNILVIVTDDQRVDTMQVMRRTRGWMDDGGVRYPYAFATTPLCCPSRSSIFSGRFAHNHGVITNFQADRLDADRTMQAYLSDAGYRTAMVGKYLNKFPVEARPPHFDRFALRENRPQYYDSRWNVQGTVKRLPGYDTHVVRHFGLRFMKAFEKRDQTPWFMYLAPIAPHLPSRPEDKYLKARVPTGPHTPAMHEDDISDKPDFIQTSPRRIGGRVSTVIRRQNRTLLSVDDMVHDLIRRLRELGESRRTLIVFLSDNGYLWRDHGLHGKTLPYLPSSKIPMYLRWPGRVAAGTEDARLVANIDVAPTVLDAAGIEPGMPMDGRSLLDPTWTRDRMFLEHGPLMHPAWNALVDHDSLYVEWDHPDGIVREYYDLASDPWELSNLFGDDDPINDPPTAGMSVQMEQDSRCAGTEAEPGGPPPCP